jgi:endonuclease/exonuclease/phosphatase family metal-dependent hydrolase
MYSQLPHNDRDHLSSYTYDEERQIAHHPLPLESQTSSTSAISYPTYENKRKLLMISFVITSILVILITVLIFLSKKTEINDGNERKDGIFLRVMSFNVWYGGSQINLQDTAAIIKDYGADIVGLQEIDANLMELSKLTGLPFFDERRFILSRFPIFNSGAGYRTEDGSGSYSINGLDSNSVHAWILIAPGKVIAFANTHLSSDPYGPDEIAAGKSSDEVMDLEIMTRGPDYTALAQALQPIAQQTTPLFLTGDFNSPSHLDWIEATVNQRPHMRYPFDWPSSRAMTDIGLRDTYREVHPDPVTHPGLTFTPGMPAPVIPTNQNLDRIDFVYASGAVEVLKSEVIDIRQHCTRNVPPVLSHTGAEVKVTALGTCTFPYPSDHSAVLSSVIVQPIDSPWLVSIKKRRVVRNQDDVEVCLSIPLDHSWSVAIVPANGNPENEAILGMFNEPMIYRRCVRFGSNPLSIGEYDAVLMNASSSAKGRSARGTVKGTVGGGSGGTRTTDEAPQEMGRVRFVVIESDTLLELGASTDVIPLSSSDPTVIIDWKYAPGGRDDFIAIYSAGTVDVNDYLGVVYTGAKFTGSLVFEVNDCNIPFTTGRYHALFMSNDQFVELGRISFEIVE